MTKRWEFWAVVGLTVVVVGLVLGGVFLGWRTEDRGFIQYSPFDLRSAGSVRYLLDESTWAEAARKGPLESVGLSPERRPWGVLVLDKEMRKEVASALRDLNSRVGCDLFGLSTDAVEADVVLRRSPEDVGEGNHAGGSTSHRLLNDRWTSRIVIYNLVVSRDLHRSLMHEFGHAVGLDHDSFRSSLMYQGVSGGSRLTDEDRNRLRKRYCGGKQ